MRSILLHVDDDKCLAARLQVALDLARGFDGHVTFLQATPYEVGIPGDVTGLMAAQILPEMREAAARFRTKTQTMLAAEDIAWDWQAVDGLAASCLLERSSLADVIILGDCDALREGPSALPGAVGIRARTPILLVPRTQQSFAIEGPALVAWDGSPEVCRALRAAVPLLARSRSVIFASVVDKDRPKPFDLPAGAGAQYLGRHGIGCEIVELPSEGRPIADVLASAAARHDAAYLVMGAYGHARLVETIWGGVTRELFARPPLPIFACH